MRRAHLRLLKGAERLRIFEYKGDPCAKEGEIDPEHVGEQLRKEVVEWLYGRSSLTFAVI